MSVEIPELVDVPKTAFLGGAGRGIGSEIAFSLASQGFDIVIAARTEDELESIDAELRAKGSSSNYVVADLALPSEVDSAIQHAHNLMGSIGVYVTCVGSHPETHPIEDYPIEYWKMMLEVNLSSVFYGAKAVTPLMKKQRVGRIISIASVASKIGPPNSAAYVAAKHGLLGLIKVMANELGPHGITANAICPGFVETKMTENKDQLRDFCVSTAPIRRAIDKTEVAELACYLAGPHGGAITGQALSVCGGLSS